jgi:hypothetical protein
LSNINFIVRYDQKLLGFLFTHCYSCYFGDFLFNNEQERSESRNSDGKSIDECTLSICDYIIDRKLEFINPFYEPSIPPPSKDGKTSQVLFPNSEHLKYWSYMYFQCGQAEIGIGDEDTNSNLKDVIGSFQISHNGHLETNKTTDTMDFNPFNNLSALTTNIFNSFNPEAESSAPKSHNKTTSISKSSINESRPKDMYESLSDILPFAIKSKSSRSEGAQSAILQVIEDDDMPGNITDFNSDLLVQRNGVNKSLDGIFNSRRISEDDLFPNKQSPDTGGTPSKPRRPPVDTLYKNPWG